MLLPIHSIKHRLLENQKVPHKKSIKDRLLVTQKGGKEVSLIETQNLEREAAFSRPKRCS